MGDLGVKKTTLYKLVKENEKEFKNQYLKEETRQKMNI